VILRRRPYRDVIERQLDLFESGDADLLDDVDGALERYNAAEADEAEELYGDYQLAIEAATDRLGELREAFARTLDDPEPYVREFNAAAIRRWRALALTIEN
jgi:septation ring formation regulator EzrA